MDRKRVRLLLIDDSEADTERLLRKLVTGGYDPVSVRVENAHALSRALLYGSWDLAVCDYSMPNFSGADALKQVKEKDAQLPFLFVSGTLPSELARKLQSEGAAGVLSKDNLESFLPTVDMILKAKGAPPSAAAPETVESLQRDRTMLKEQVRMLERMAVDLRARLDRAVGGATETTGSTSAPPKILLVDDRVENLSALDALVAGTGAVTVRATSGREALERLLEEDFALILMDVRMPEMDGFETAQLVHRRKRSRATPIVFLTAHGIVFLTAHGDDTASILRGYESGAVDYLPKPVVPEILRAKVAIFLELYAKSELLRRQAEHLAALNRELEAFSGTVSHDLKAPLRAIRSWTQIVLEEYKGKTLDGEAEATLQRVLEAGDRMDGLIRGLLNYAKVSRAEISIERLDLDEIGREAYEAVKPELDARKAQVRLESPLGFVKAHRTSLVQAVANLLSNANKFTASQTVPRVTIRSESKAGRRRLWVEDNGIGIASGDRERIFRPFERLHGGSEYAGHGIGLAIVQRAAERIGGSVGVESVVGQGSRFWIELPEA
jgi:two-component system, sensor histidine kinase and response regulator